MELGRQARTAGAGKLVGVDPRDQLGLHPGLQDAPRLGDAEVALVTPDVAEPSSRNVGVSTPLGDLLRVGAKSRPAGGSKAVRRQVEHLDPRQVLALAKPRKHPRGLELAFAIEVIAGLRLHGGRATFEPHPEPSRGELLQRAGRLGSRGLDCGADASALFRHFSVCGPSGASGELGHAIARVRGMRVSVDETSCDQTARAVVVFADGFHQLVRLLPMRTAPRDLVAVADDCGILDHADRSPGEQPSDIAQASHCLATTVLPPTTTLVTSPAEHAYMR